MYSFYLKGGGNVKIENRKISMEGVKSKIGSLDNAKHTPKGGDKKASLCKIIVVFQGRMLHYCFCEQTLFFVHTFHCTVHYHSVKPDTSSRWFHNPF